MYDQPTNFGFTGSTMGALPTTLDQINPAYLHQIGDFIAQKGGRLASVTGVVLYDTLRMDAGQTVTKDFSFFQNGIGSTQPLFVAGTNYTKQEIDVTPWVNMGTLAAGYEALVWGIGVQFHLTEAKDASVQTSGNAINLVNDPGGQSTLGATDTIRQANVLRGLQESTYFKLFVNSTPFEDGPGWRFPSGPYGVGGGIALGGVVAGPIGDGALSNGFGWSYQLPVMRHIPSLTKFGVKMSLQNAINLTNVGPLRVVVTLEGIGIQPVTG